MSITVEIQQHCELGKLRLHEPLRRSYIVNRHVFVGEMVRQFLEGHESVDSSFDRVAGRTIAILDRFVNGSYVTFGIEPHDKNSHSQIARVDPRDQGIVDYRITDPNPQVRIFGGFAAPDVLVLLTWAPRAGLNFRAEVTKCRAAWDELFPQSPPIVSDKVEHHVSKHFRLG